MNQDPNRNGPESLPANQDELRETMDLVKDTFDEAYEDATEIGHDSIRYSLGEDSLSNDPLGYRFDRVDIDFTYADDLKYPGLVVPSMKMTLVGKNPQDSDNMRIIVMHESGYDMTIGGLVTEAGGDVAQFGDMNPFENHDVHQVMENSDSVKAAFSKAPDISITDEDVFDESAPTNGGRTVSASDLADVKQILSYINTNDPHLANRYFED